MDEELLLELYETLGGSEVIGEWEEFKSYVKKDPNNLKKVHKEFSKKIGGTEEEFVSLMTTKVDDKKKSKPLETKTETKLEVTEPIETPLTAAKQKQQDKIEEVYQTNIAKIKAMDVTEEEKDKALKDLLTTTNKIKKKYKLKGDKEAYAQELLRIDIEGPGEELKSELNLQADKLLEEEISGEGADLNISKLRNEAIQSLMTKEDKQRVKEGKKPLNKISQDQINKITKQLYVQQKSRDWKINQANELLENFETDFGVDRTGDMYQILDTWTMGKSGSIIGAVDLLKDLYEGKIGKGEDESWWDFSVDLASYVGGTRDEREYSDETKELYKNLEVKEKELDKAGAYFVQQTHKAKFNADKAKAIIDEHEGRIKAKDETYTEEDYNEYMQAFDDYNKAVELYKENEALFNATPVPSDDFKTIKNLTLKTYDNLQMVGNNIANSIVSLGSGVATVAHELSVPELIKWGGIDIESEEGLNAIFGEDEEGFTGVLKEGARIYGDINEPVGKAIRQGFELADYIKDKNAPIVAFDDVKTLEDFAMWGMDMGSGQIINTALTIAIPPAGLILMSAGEAGRKMNEMNIEIEGVKDEDGNWIVEPKDINAAQYFSTAVLYGGIEYVTERVSLGILKGVGKNVSKAFQVAGKSGPNISLRNVTNAQSWGKFGLDFSKNSFKEAGAEGLVTLVNNATDILILDKKDVGILDGMTESMLSGFLMGNTFQVPGIAAQVKRSFSSEGEYGKANKLNAELLELSEARDKKGVSEKAQGKIQDRINEILKIQFEASENVKLRALEMTPQDRKDVIDKTNNQHKLRREIDNLNEDLSVNEKTKVTLINGLAKQIQLDQAVKERIFAEYGGVERAEQSAERAKQQLEKVKGAVESAGLATDIVEVESAEELQKVYKDKLGEDISEEEANKKSKDNFGMFLGKKDKDGKRVLILNKSEIEKYDAWTTAQHEVLHEVLNNMFKGDMGDNAYVLANSLKEKLSELDIDAIQNSDLSNRLAAYNLDQDVTDQDAAEEVLTLFSEALATGDIKFNEGFFTKIKDTLRRVLQSIGLGGPKFNTAEDVYNFIKDYNKSIEKGKFTTAQKTAMEEGVTVSETLKEKSKKPSDKVKRVEQIVKKKEAIIKDFYADQGLTTKTSKDKASKNIANETQQEKSKRQDKRNVDVGKIYNERAKGKNKEEWNEFLDSARGDKAMGDLIQQYYPDMIATAIRQNAESPMDVASEAMIPLMQHIRAFDPSKNDDLAGYIGGYLGLKVGTARKSVAKKTATISMEQEGVRQVAEKQAVKETAEKEASGKKDKVTPRAKLIRDFPEIFDQELKDDFETAGLEIFEGETPDVEGRDFRDFTTEAFRVKTKAKVKKKLGAGKKYEFNIKKLAPKLKENLPIQWFVRMEGSTPVNKKKFTSPPKRLTKQEDIDKAMLDDKVYVEVASQGVNTYEFKDFTAKELADFILAPLVNPITGKASGTRGTRKTGLAEGLVDLFGRQVSPTVVKKVEKVKEKLPQISAKLQVDPRTKFSKQMPTDKQWLKMLNNPADLEIVKAGYKKNIAQAIVNEIDPAELAQMIADVEGKKRDRGYESAIYRVGMEVAKKYPGLKLNYVKSTEKGGAADVSFTLNGVLFEAEVKLDKPQYSGVGVNYNIKTGKITFVKDFEFNNQIKKALEKNLDNIDFYINRANEIGKDLFGNEYTSIESFNDSLPLEVTDALGKEMDNIQKNVTTEFVGTIDIVKELYAAKNQDYIQILGRGLFSLEKNPLKLPIPSLDGDVNVSVRIVKTAIGSKSGGTATHSKPSNSRGMTNIRLRALPNKLINSTAESDFSLDNASSFLKLLNTPQVKIIKTKEKAKKESVKIIGKSEVKNSKSFSKSPSNEVIRQAEILDKALNIARDPNAPVKKIRVFDFDDTLARTKSGVKYTMPNETGKPQPGRKAILLVGSAGAGKSTLVNKLGLRKQGYKYVNQDVALDWLAKNAGLPKDMNEFTDAETSKWRDLQSEAAQAAKTKATRLQGEGSGVIIDATGSSSVGFEKTARELADAGYDAHIVFVDSSLDTALKRNKARGERKLTDTTVRNSYEAVQKNKREFSEYTGRMVMGKPLAKEFTEINTDNLKQGDPLPAEFISKINDFTSGYVKGRLTAEEFAQRGTELLEQGAEFDFSEFNKVKEGKKGPLLDVAKAIQEARGTKDVFVLTARSAEAATAIKEFLDSQGLDIPLQNITGLGDSSPLAKSGWMVDKAADGYNDFYFADDHMANVDAVKRVLDVIDVKSKVQQAKVKFSKNVDKMMNNIIYEKTGIEQYKEFSEVTAKARGRKTKSFDLIPPSAQDFGGLLYKLLAKGETGNTQWKWMQDHLIKPYGRAMNDLSVAQNQLMADFRALKESLIGIPKNLKKEAVQGFTNEDVVRVATWDRQGIKVEGISKKDLNAIRKYVEGKPDLTIFIDQLIAITKGDGYYYPGANWLAGTITTDFREGLRQVTRKNLLKQWEENVDLAFNESNMNKIEAAFGPKYREALENSLFRMKTGQNRRQGMSSIEQNFLDYLNNSVGAVMFLNARSAVLQTISAVNFLNWKDNNPAKAAAAFANQPRYWKDFMTLMNSDFLVDRRNGLKINVSESEIAEAAKTAKNTVKGVISLLLNKGFMFTQIADSFAIASGGATLYRNRIKTYMKEGMSEADATEKAFLDFRELAEESQQSARADKISQQQASTLGRLVLAFANTPSQYARIMDKAGKDLIAGRGDWKANMSKIAYYGVIQNLLFTALQSALFAYGMDDQEEEETRIFPEDKMLDTANSMADNLLRGIGVAGVILAQSKNMIIDLVKRSQKDPYFNPDAKAFPGPNYEDAVEKLLAISPPISIKYRKIKGGITDWYFNRWRPEASEQFNINNPSYRAASKVIAGVTNVPLDRLFQKIENIQGAMDDTNQTWQRVFMLLGWPKWQLETPKEKEKRKAKEKEERRNIRAEDKPSIYTKDEQVNILKQYELSDEEIKELKNEELRVDKIEQLRDSTKVTHTPQAIKSKPKPKVEKKDSTSYKPSSKVKTTSKSIPKKKSTRNKILLEDRTKQQARLYKLKKSDQLDTLKSLGLSGSMLDALTYEEDRVRKIEELYDKNK